MKLLHKFYREYTVKEIKRIKEKHCQGCIHYGYSCTKKELDDEKLNNRDCDYLLHEEKRRVVRPEICPHNRSKEGVVCHEGEMYADFDIYCPRCKHCKLDMKESPCDVCLKNVVLKGTDRPLKWEAKE